MKSLDKAREITNLLRSAGIEYAEREAEMFITVYLGIDHITLFRDNPEINNGQMSAIDDMINRRIKREPMQYILETVDFLGLKLMVGIGVLIPRPETELMAEYAIERVKGQRSEGRLRILDLCTGSGCLALALAKEFPDAEVFGVDISESATQYARKNADLNNIRNATFLTGNLFEPFHKRSTLDAQHITFDLIISNPPYIKSADIKTLQPEIKEWEPLHALDGGPDGLDLYRAIIPPARNFLKKDGVLVMELGIGCADGVRDLFSEAGYSRIEIIKDYAGIERIASARK
ncbi:MAG: peptide chain release factor N(5)-glutamine methyltransferase [Nitrospiraceae bacterium]|nr:MAG: peptide chain release factor N(5)-glutamine methyltransferase [Nitrospiraceae bacterium]